MYEVFRIFFFFFSKRRVLNIVLESFLAHSSKLKIVTVMTLCRSSTKYRLFSGLWFGEDKPFFSTFFKPFIDKMSESQVKGNLLIKKTYLLYVLGIEIVQKSYTRPLREGLGRR